MHWLRTVRSSPWSAARLAALGGLLLVALIPTTPGDERSRRTSVPARTDAHERAPAAWKARGQTCSQDPGGPHVDRDARSRRHTEEFLAEPAAQHMAKDLLLHKGFVIAVSDAGDNNTTCTIVLKGLGRRRAENWPVEAVPADGGGARGEGPAY